MTDVLKLDEQVCFPLYAASREITQLYNQFLVELDLTYPQYLVLLVLWEQQNQSVNQLGDKLLLDSGTLTPLLKRMESKDLVHRQRSAVDERVVEISLTYKGNQLKDKAEPIPTLVSKHLGLTVEEFETLKAITKKILHYRK